MKKAVNVTLNEDLWERPIKHGAEVGDNILDGLILSSFRFSDGRVGENAWISKRESWWRW